MNADRLLFIHIPKTGGMSIRNVLESYLFSCGWGNRHLSALELYRLLTPELFNKLYKFTVIRNPYDRLVSYYYYMLIDPACKDHIVHKMSLSDYVEWACNGYVSTQFFQISIESRIVVDKILRFENLDEDWKELAAEFNLPLTLPHKNAAKSKVEWETELTLKDMEKIYKSFEVDFKMLDYAE